MVRGLRWHCPPDTVFEIRPLVVWGRARYLSVTEAPHNTHWISSHVSGGQWPLIHHHHPREVVLAQFSIKIMLLETSLIYSFIFRFQLIGVDTMFDFTFCEKLWHSSSIVQLNSCKNTLHPCCIWAVTKSVSLDWHSTNVLPYKGKI